MPRHLCALLAASLLMAGCATFRTPPPPPPEPETHAGRANVIDGNTLDVDGVRVRLAGIDAPELEQLCRRGTGLPYRCGQDSAQVLSNRLMRDRVVCEVVPENDDHFIGICQHYDLNLNEWMVRGGHAVADGKDSPYVGAEAEAARAGIGMWEGTFERPSEWRRKRR